MHLNVPLENPKKFNLDSNAIEKIMGCKLVQKILAISTQTRLGRTYYESWVLRKSWILFYFIFLERNVSTNKMELFCSLVELSSSTN
jgi:hypothetical protein